MTRAWISFRYARGFVYILLAVFNLLLSDVSAKQNYVFASIEHMKPLVEIEKQLVDISRDYLNEQKRKLSELAPFAKAVEEAMMLNEADAERYLANPVNCYLIIKRFTFGWYELKSRLDVDESRLKHIKYVLDVNDIYLPSEEVDVHGATAAIIRLMDNYDISAREIADGNLRGVEAVSQQLSAKDCMDIAEIVHNTRRYVRMKQWLLEAERLMNDPTMPHRHGNVDRKYVHEYLSWSYYLENDLTNALKYTNLVLRDDPTNEEALRNREIYTWYVERNVPCTQPETKYMNAAQLLLNQAQKSPYIQMCKKKKLKVKGYRNVWNLSCFYRQDSPRLYLKPIKVTQLHDNPEVYIMHDVISERDMKRLKDLSTPRLRVAEVLDPYNGSRISAPYRVAKSMFLMSLFPADRDIADRLDPIFEAITGLSMEHSEELQMNNYGLGGQYEFHHDYGEPGTSITKSPERNRIATLLLYLSNVERGGETVFTEIGLSIPPMKGSAVVWYNLYRNGTVFYNTKHASCPVISGSKWVANKWIREAGNEFRRLCSLNQFE